MNTLTRGEASACEVMSRIENLLKKGRIAEDDSKKYVKKKG